MAVHVSGIREVRRWRCLPHPAQHQGHFSRQAYFVQRPTENVIEVDLYYYIQLAYPLHAIPALHPTQRERTLALSDAFALSISTPPTRRSSVKTASWSRSPATRFAEGFGLRSRCSTLPPALFRWKANRDHPPVRPKNLADSSPPSPISHHRGLSVSKSSSGKALYGILEQLSEFVNLGEMPSQWPRCFRSSFGTTLCVT